MASDGGGLKPESTWKPRNEIFFVFLFNFWLFLKVHPFWILDYAPNYLVGGYILPKENSKNLKMKFGYALTPSLTSYTT